MSPSNVQNMYRKLKIYCTKQKIQIAEIKQVNMIKIYGYFKKEKKSAENLLSAYSEVIDTKIVVDPKAVYSLLNTVLYISD